MSFQGEIAEALADIRTEWGLSAAYLRGDQAIELNAIAKGDRVFKFVDNYGITQRVETTSFLIPADVLKFIDAPRPGDIIRQAFGDSVAEYEVASVNGEPCWLWSDPEHTALRVHTCYVNSNNPGDLQWGSIS